MTQGQEIAQILMEISAQLNEIANQLQNTEAVINNEAKIKRNLKIIEALKRAHLAYCEDNYARVYQLLVRAKNYLRV